MDISLPAKTNDNVIPLRFPWTRRGKIINRIKPLKKGYTPTQERRRRRKPFRRTTQEVQ